METPLLDCLWEQPTTFLSLAVNHVLSLYSLSLLLYSNQSFLTSHNHSYCLALDYLLLDNILRGSAKNWWKYSSWDLTSVEQAGNTLDVSLSSTSMTAAGPCTCSDLLHASQPLKNCRCSPSCVLQLTIRSEISSTSFYWTSPFFFPQDISPIHHNYSESQLKHSQSQFTYFGNPFCKIKKVQCFRNVRSFKN